MAYLQDKCKKINVRINSGGGSVLDGYAIVSSILNSSVPCDCYVDGLAASMAAVIAVAGKKCFMADYGMFMIHEAQGGSDKAVTALFTDTINTILTKRTNRTTEEIATLLKAETWMTAKECLAHGFVDEIIDSNKPIKKVKANASIDEIIAVFNENLNQTNTNKMKNITASLKLAENASELDVVNAISVKDAEIAKLTNENKSLKDKMEAVENAAKEVLKNKATTLVEKAVSDKKITEAEKAALIDNASSSEANFSLVENILGKISVVKEAAQVFNSAVTKVGDERSTWSWTDWSKNDPSGLAKMQNESPALHDSLYNKEFKTTK
jgi:ATP-dependent protease ClpP protease subunit